MNNTNTSNYRGIRTYNRNGRVYVHADNLPNVSYRKHVAARVLASKLNSNSRSVYRQVNRGEINGRTIYYVNIK